MVSPESCKVEVEPGRSALFLWIWCCVKNSFFSLLPPDALEQGEKSNGGGKGSAQWRTNGGVARSHIQGQLIA